MNKTPKFTKKEQAKLAVVFQMLRDEATATLRNSDSPYNNSLPGFCSNCGDSSGQFTMLYRLEQEVGLRKPDPKS